MATNNSNIPTSNNPQPTASATAVRCVALQNELGARDSNALLFSSTSDSLSFSSCNNSVANVKTPSPILKTQFDLFDNSAGKVHQRKAENSLPNFLNYLGAQAKYYDLQQERVNANSNFYFGNVIQIVQLIGGLVDIRLIASLILLAVIIIPYKMVIVTMPYAKTESLFEISNFTQTKFLEALNWANENQLTSKLSPLLCGLAVAIFSCMMVYMDSNVPGISPPSPFSPRKQRQLLSPEKQRFTLELYDGSGSWSSGMRIDVL